MREIGVIDAPLIEIIDQPCYGRFGSRLSGRAIIKFLAIRALETTASTCGGVAFRAHAIAADEIVISRHDR